MEDVVAQDQADRVVTDELLADQEGLGQTFWRRLLGIGELHAELAAIPQKLAVLGQILACRDHQDLADASQHQHRDRVIDHRFVVNR
ncbi:hypothetical protein D9M73_256180 [compost metagenome]